MNIIEQSHKILTPIVREDVYKLIEQAGRTAYKSEDRITEGSAEKFIKSIIARGHESVLEHFNISVRFITDRGVTHELVRHRLCAFTQESTRYCNYSEMGMTFIKPVFWNPSAVEPNYEKWWLLLQECENVYDQMVANGATPQEARSVLPNSLKTEIVVTANIREWRHILMLRTNTSAHPQMIALMLPLQRELQTLLPALF